MTIKFRSFFLSLILYSFLNSAPVPYSGVWETFNKENTDLPSNNILCVTIDNIGTKWFGTDQGLVQFNDEIWITYSSEIEQNLADNYINDMIFESDSSQSLLWIATENGISLLDITNPESLSFSVPYRTDNSPLVDDGVKTLTVDPGHVSWFGTLNGLSSFVQNIWGTYTTQNFWIDHDKIVSLESGPDSMVYIGTEGGGVSRLKMESVDAVSSASTLTTSWTGFDEPDSGKLTSNNVFSILVEPNGHQWFGTDSGVALHTSYNTLRDWKNYTSADGLINDFVQAICKENENIFWFGTPQGVSRFDGSLWKSYTSEDGLAHNNVRDIALDNDGSLWFATENGISVLSNTTAIACNKTTNEFDPLQISNFPNPFNLNTSIEFKLNTKAFVEIDIYNSIGQHIVSLASALLAAGEHSYNWNGFNAAGSVVPSGVYFVQLSNGKRISTHKILIIK